MDPDEKRVSCYFKDRELMSTRFSKAEIRTGKTPDFRVSQNGALVFYCEVKSIKKDTWLDKQIEESEPGKLAGGLRKDPIFNRLTADIHEAVKQFNAVNKDEKYPNVLALVNHDKMCGFNDLLAILTGNFYVNDGTTHPIYEKFSDGHIKDEKIKIHLFIWIDNYKKDRLLFSQTNDAHQRLLCSVFGISQNSIKQIQY